MCGLKHLSLLTCFALLTACNAAPRVQVIKPPTALYEPSCAGSLLEPRQAPFTNLDLLTYSIDLRAALRGCEADREALRIWNKELK